MTEERKDTAHILKRTIEFDTGPDSQDKHDVKTEEKLKNFEWDNSQEAKENLPSVPFQAEDIDGCVALLLSCLFDGITTENFNGSDPSGMRFVISVDLEIHNLLRDRFVEGWDLDSRLDMFDAIREGLDAVFFADDTKKVELDQKILEALPASHRKKFESDDIYVADDAMTVGEESDMVSIEVPIHFVAN